MPSPHIFNKIYGAFTSAERDDMKADEPKNGMVHIGALSLTKLADALINPKLVLSWMLATLGAPGALIGALVPVREAGALLPQLALANKVERTSQRRVFWASGSALQGIAAIGIGFSALMFEGAAAGWAIVTCLALLAIARSACSLSYKDALARSIPKGRRGSLTGAAAAFGSAVSLGFAVLLSFGIIPLTITALAITCIVAGALWLVGSAIFMQLSEEGDDTKPAGSSSSIRALFAPLREDAQLRLFIASRALLTVTALAPPFILMLSAGGEANGGIGTLGPMLLASAAASILSSWVWGRLSDNSSRQTLMISGALAALTYAALAAWALASEGNIQWFVAVGSLFAAQIAYEGVRAGRKLHLTDMTGDDRRARYTALSNTMIGIVLLVGSGFGVLADLYGPAIVIALFAICAIAGSAITAGLNEVQQDAD